MKRQLAGTFIMLAMLAIMTSIIACNLGSTNIRASAVAPGPVLTPVPQSTQPIPPTQPLPGIMATQTPQPSPAQALPSPTPTLGIGSTKQSAKDGMLQVFVPAGQFIMGSDSYNEIMSAPVSLDAFWIDQTEVTNAMFAQFISSTKYRTDAEKRGYGYVYKISSDDFSKDLRSQLAAPPRSGQ